MMAEKGFKYGKPVLPPYFVNREEELDRLYDLVSSIKDGAEKNVALMGLRRTGKTSLLKVLEKRLENDKRLIPVFIDCYGLPSKSTFAKILLDKVKDSYIQGAKDRNYAKKLSDFMKKRTSEWLSKLSSLEVSITDYLSIKMAFKEEGSEEIWIRALEYPEKLGNEKDVYFVIIMDEFPDIAMRWKEDFIKRFRSVIQHQMRVVYILSGSAVSFMAELTYDKTSPFYRQLVPIKLDELPEDIAREFILKRLRIEKKALDDYIRLTGCFPDYIQRLGHLLMDMKIKRKINKDDITAAYEDMIWELEIEYSNTMRMLNNLSDIYGDILIAAVQESSRSKIAREMGVDPPYLSRYLSYLIRIGIIRKEKRGEYFITDPVFKDWIISRFDLIK
jgi:AAA+ ATPase superfamily predicted ATPase